MLKNSIDELEVISDRGTAEGVADKAKGEKKRLKKIELMEETGVLSPWERYRALIEQMRHHTDLIEMADRKSRFGLVVLSISSLWRGRIFCLWGYCLPVLHLPFTSLSMQPCHYISAFRQSARSSPDCPVVFKTTTIPTA